MCAKIADQDMHPCIIGVAGEMIASPCSQWRNLETRKKLLMVSFALMAHAEVFLVNVEALEIVTRSGHSVS